MTTEIPTDQEPTSSVAQKRATLPLRPISITSSERRKLRAKGHHLKPVVQIGQGGMSEGVIQATQVALEQHELIKVSINGESPTERKSGAEDLGKATGSHVVQVIGRVILLYRLRKKQIDHTKPKGSIKATERVKTDRKQSTRLHKKA